MYTASLERLEGVGPMEEFSATEEGVGGPKFSKAWREQLSPLLGKSKSLKVSCMNKTSNRYM